MYEFTHLFGVSPFLGMLVRRLSTYIGGHREMFGRRGLVGGSTLVCACADWIFRPSVLEGSHAPSDDNNCCIHASHAFDEPSDD